MNPIRILLLDDHRLFRESLSRLLETETDFKVSDCGTAAEALHALAKEPFDLVLLDFDLGNETSSNFLSGSRQVGYHGPILMVTAGISDNQAIDLICQGVSGIFLKNDSPELLAEIIRKIVNGETWLDQRYLRALAQAASRPAGPRRRNFTERETQVLKGVFEGMSNKEIADRLQVSEGSVKASLQQLFHKTGVRTRSQLVRIALEQYADQL